MQILWQRIWPPLALAIIVGSLFPTGFFFDHLPNFPSASKQHPVSVDKAYADLQLVTAKPHPYNSHQNDIVRNILLRRVQELASNFSNIEYDDDLVSNITFARSDTAVYFEGTNILVRVRGKTSLPPVLISAHYDSVSTAPGATDDGIGAVTLLQLIEAFGRSPAQRDVIFNINNGEEDGLHGALAFIQHAWSQGVSSFLNLEGAGGGGQAMMFRSTTINLARKFDSAPHPHANSIAEDALERRLIKSGTDYTVYTKAGIPGSDVAFFRRRAVYHTKDDSIPSLAGKRPLWSMLESAYYTARSIAEDEGLDASSGGRGVYFDLFGEAMIVASLRLYFILNIVLLAGGAIVVGLGVFFGIRRKKIVWTRLDWIKFPIALVVSLAGIALPVVLVVFVNPFIMYSSSSTVLAMQLSSCFLALHLSLLLLTSSESLQRQKSAVIFQLFIFTWILLLLDVIAIGHSGNSGLYFITWLYTSTLSALLIVLVEDLDLLPNARRQFKKHVLRGNGQAEGDDSSSSSSSDDEPHETTPLIPRESSEASQTTHAEGLLFAAQYIIAALFPDILLFELTLILLASLQGTLADGNSPASVYLLTTITAFFVVAPHAPFLHRIGYRFAALTAAIFILSTLYNCVVFPFDHYSPLKIRFSQSVDLDEGVNRVSVSGVMRGGYIEHRILPEIPSASYAGNNYTCDNKIIGGLGSCQWIGIAPRVAEGKPDKWLTIETIERQKGLGVIKVQGEDTRFCKIYFDKRVKRISIGGSAGEFHIDYPMPPEGVKELHLWSRSWNRTFEVEVGWDESTPISGKASCGWDDIREGYIPAFDELLAFVPPWATVTKAKPGLVEVSKKFSF